ncbi:hypothetical protein [Corynebacterium pygosceleis]|uniref:hypothetical protein n=1 Tax=Corynebacterium pygosceleis TaxID=2800406 RepID=UPI0020060F8F|nr:hypothetical protein [Corynebacterium pygosceleis]MCK7676384.1 hypothetical protein [Corynebacterium pygosceleis]
MPPLTPGEARMLRSQLHPAGQQAEHERWVEDIWRCCANGAGWDQMDQWKHILDAAQHLPELLDCYLANTPPTKENP